MKDSNEKEDKSIVVVVAAAATSTFNSSKIYSSYIRINQVKLERRNINTSIKR
jgi:hypothetical protein